MTETKNIDDQILAAATLTRLASSFLRINDKEQAMTALEQALIVTDNIEDPLARCTALSGIAPVCFRINDHEKTLRVIRRFSPVAGETKRKDYVIQSRWIAVMNVVGELTGIRPAVPDANIRPKIQARTTFTPEDKAFANRLLATLER